MWERSTPMDTPERSKIAGAPISKFEDSPIFNFINNLSPIQPVKSVHDAQSFPSLSYASISSVFSSPHVNSQKESRFLIRQPSPDSSKFETSSESVVENNLCTGLSNVTKLFSYSAVAQEKSSVTCFLNEATVDPPDECLTQPSNLAQSQYDCGSPNHNMTPSYGIKVDPKINTDQAPDEVVPFVPDGVERRKILFATEIELQEKHQQEGSEQDVSGCDWEDLISNDADEMLIFDSPIESEACKDQDENLEDKANTLSSSISQLTDEVDIPQNKQPEVSYDLCPNHNMTPSYGIKVDPKINTDQAPDEVVPFVPDGVERRKILFATEIELQEKHQQEGSEQDVSGCDWEDLISNDADEMLIFDSPIESEACKDQDENLEDKAKTLSSSKSQLTDEVDIPQNKQSEVSYDLCLKNATDPIIGNNGDAGEQHGVDRTPQILGTSQKQAELSDKTQKIGKGKNTCTSLGCKVDSQHHRGMRRRCLVFEVSGVSGKKSNNNSTFQPSVSYSLPSTGKFTSEDRHLTLLRPGSSLSSRMLPGIGLHLNTLATVSKDRMVTPETLSSGRSLVSMPCTISPFPPLTASKSLDTEKDQCPGNEVRDFEDVHNDSCGVPTVGVGEDLNHSSPKKKKRRSDNGGESEACKRCNCKKSKCLKLYCECFAAGIYCVEPCSCQGCFNKPVHEEIVLATRKQIESRNPLAFAPKVIRASEPVQDPGEETNKTPASARHKRGCNCKKSSCLKKYCECYQSGVGCSASCRCEGCKNAFGRKDGAEEIEHEEEEKDDCEKLWDKSVASQQNAVAQNVEHPLAIIPVSPCLQICSPTVQLPFLSSGKPPRSSSLAVGYQTSKMRRKCDIPLPRGKIDKHFKTALDDDTPEILRNDSSPNAGVKTCSPNGKRVSPPHISLGMSPNRKGARKLILKSIPSFPSLSSTAPGNYTVNYSSGSFSSSTMS